jgi:hypothetical protein
MVDVKSIIEERKKRLENAVMPESCGYHRLLEERALLHETITVQPDYDFFLKKDEWSEDEIINLFNQQDPEKLLDLIRASISAKKLKRLKWLMTDGRNGQTYFFDPFVIVDWAIAKELNLPTELIEWHGQQLNKTNDCAPEIEHDTVDQKISKNDTEYNLRTIGALALLLIEKTNTNKFGTREKPNKAAIYTAIQQLLSDMGLNEDGQAKTRMNDVLKKALDMAFTPKNSLL